MSKVHLTALNTFWKAIVTEETCIGTELKSKRLLDLVHGGMQDTSCIFTDSAISALCSHVRVKLELYPIPAQCLGHKDQPGRHQVWGGVAVLGPRRGSRKSPFKTGNDL